MAGGTTVQVEVLGPLRVRDAGGEDRTPDGPLQRRLLALLVLHRGRSVSVDAAVDALWPAQPPRDPNGALQTHLSRLRRALPDGAISSTGDGYRLDAAAVELDAERLAAALAAGGPDLLGEVETVLARWDGPAYPDLSDHDDGRLEQVRLEELRVLAQETCADARLRAGLSDEVVADLTALVTEHPLRERPRALLMAALARSGRAAEALRTYDDLRRRLAEELGIEPSSALQAQHAELLRGEVAGAGGWAPATRLPTPVTSFFGREALVGEVVALAGEHRLVTLVGPGGVGKTRLAIEAGRRLLADRPDRPVVLVELATATPDAAVDAVAAALAVEGRPDVGLAERLVAVLADLEVVLMLDNCEHVLDPVAGLVDRLLPGCPNVVVVATSRERLRVPGERLCTVPPLALEGTDGPAIRLFLDRARAVAPDFEPTARDHDRIVEITQRLDGLPLAIELAAARLHTLEVSEVAAGLDRRFRLLASGSRASSRHGSLGAAVGWSVGLLDEELRRTFAQLSVFSGSFSVDGATAICAAPAEEVAASLDQLAERSLLMRAPGRRHVLLETLRAYGAELLDADGEEVAVRRRHARYVIDQVEAADATILDPGHEQTLLQLDDALPELRSAFDWLLESADLDGATRIVLALYDYSFLRLRPDVTAWAHRLRAADPDGMGPRAPDVAAASALAAWMAGDLDEMARHVARATTLLDQGGWDDAPDVATLRGSQALFEGRLDDAIDQYERACELSADDRPQWVMAAGARVLALGYAADPRAEEAASELLAAVAGSSGPHAAYAWYCAGEPDLQGDLDRARQRLDTAIELAETSGAAFVRGAAGTSRASIEVREGDLSAAAAEFRLLLAHWRRAGMWSTQWTSLRTVAVLLEATGRPHEAAVLAGAVLSTRSGHRIFGDDEVALTEVAERLRQRLGDEAYDAALAAGAQLDGPAAVEHALRSL